MKRIAFLLLTSLIAASSFAKTTYIPYYYSQISIVKDGVERCDSSKAREMFMASDDAHYSFTVMHDSVTRERVKAIKNMKAAEGWSIVAGMLGGVSAGLNPLHNGRDAVNFMISRDIIVSSAFLHQVASHEGNALQQVPTSILFENYSDKEMTINDLQRGLLWFVAPHSSLTLQCGNPEVNEFRVAYNDNTEIEYVTIQSGNYLDKKEISYEDENVWISPITYTYDAGFDKEELMTSLAGFLVIDKITFEETTMSVDEFKKFKKEHKE